MKLATTNGHGHANGHAHPPSFAADRMPPANLEAERSTLGSCLVDGSVIHELVAMGLRADDFFRADHAEIWTAIADMDRAGTDVDPCTLADHLERIGSFERLGGDGMLRELVESVPHAANARYYAGIVRERAVGRRLIEACTSIIGRCYSHQYTAADLVCEAQEQMLAIGDRDAGSDTVSYSILMDEVLTRAEVRRQDGSTGTSCGFVDIDAVTCGFRPGELTILAARPGMGKTSLSLDFAENVARGGHPVLFFSIEMGRESLGDRIITGESGVDSDRFRTAWVLDESEWRRLRNAAANLCRLPLEIDFSPSRSVAQIAAQARRHQRRHGLGLVVVDYVQLIKGSGGERENREQVVAEISRCLKELARSLSVPVLALAQLNREVEKRADKTPQLADLRESGAIEQDADVVFLLWRPDYYNPADRKGVAEVVVAKNRNGRTGIVPLSFTANCTRFESLARGGQQDADRIPY